MFGVIMKYKYFIIFLFLFFLSFQVTYAIDDANHNASDIIFNIFKVDKVTFNSTDLIKNYNNQSQYQVQILKDGKSIEPNQEVLMRVNGVDYHTLTDSNGVATLNIRLNPGHYIVYSEFENYRNYNNILVFP